MWPKPRDRGAMKPVPTAQTLSLRLRPHEIRHMMVLTLLEALLMQV